MIQEIKSEGAFWIYNDLKTSKIGGMLRAQLELVCFTEVEKFVLKESNQDYAEFIADFGYW